MKRILCNIIIVAVILVNVVGCIIKVKDNYYTDSKEQDAYENKIDTISQNAIDEFMAITKVPRPSYHLDKIRDYLTQYAKEHSFEYNRDEYGNFWMDIPATKGCEDYPKVILQGHMDMVCASEDGYDIDFETTPITAVKSGNTITADRTSLGADDGMGMGIILAVVTSDISHGPIRALITADEEVGLLGAGALPPEAFDGDYLINIDDDVSNEIIYSCAGNLRASFEKQCNVDKHSPCYDVIDFSISGLLGGHSGNEIGKNRLSAATVMSEILNSIKDSGISFEIGCIDGGTAENAIAPKADVKIAVPKESQKKVETIIKDVTSSLKTKYPKEKLEVEVSVNDDESTMFISSKDSLDYLSLLSSLPQGVLAMSEKEDGLVETSSNVGVFVVDNGKCKISTSSRSSITEKLEYLRLKYDADSKKLGYSFIIESNYPGWSGESDTELIKLVSKGYQKATGKDTDIVAIHAGIECAWFSRKCEDIQLVSIGPRIDDCHTVNETLYIDTVKPCVETVIYTLENIKDIKLSK